MTSSISTGPTRERSGSSTARRSTCKPRFMNGKTLERVLLDEKERERRVRRYRPNAIRWGWEIALNPEALARRLMHHGLRPLP